MSSLWHSKIERERERKWKSEVSEAEKRDETGKYTKEGSNMMPIKGKGDPLSAIYFPDCHTDQTVILWTA